LVKRWSVVSARSFEEVLERLTAPIGRTDLREFERAMAAAKTLAELEKVVLAAAGPSGFMEVARYDHGAVLRKERGGEGPKTLRLLIGNPLIMKEMARVVPDAASHAPTTILVDERATACTCPTTRWRAARALRQPGCPWSVGNRSAIRGARGPSACSVCQKGNGV
jgi:hypothetical protein